jgi:hypothetical protein
MTTLRSFARLAALGALLLSTGCAQLIAANATPIPMTEGQLTPTLRQADLDAAAMRFGVADRLLSEFAETHGGTPGAVETLFWRAMFKLDPANETATRRDALVLLDGYLNGSTVVAHRGAALALRRFASLPDRTTGSVAVTPASPSAAPGAATEVKAPDRSRDEEIQRLKDELAKANAELERIRKRLSQPNP